MTLATLAAALDISPDPGRLWAAAAVAAAWLALCGLVALSHWRGARQSAGAAGRLAAGAGDRAAMLVAFASQTGFAEEIAWRTADALRAAGTPVRLAPLGQLDGAALAVAGRALFVVATTGEGDAPDSAAGFARRVLAGSAPLAGLRYGVLALGDRSYAQFCAFGRRLDEWLRRHDATRMFETVEVDDGDAGALGRWRDHMAALGAVAQPVEAGGWEPWRLVERRLLNPGSAHPAWHVALAPAAGRASWQAGDIARIAPGNDPAEVARLLSRLGLDGDAPVDGPDGTATLARLLGRSVLPVDADAFAGLDADATAARLQPLPWREYSIASLPASGRIELLVRGATRPDGRPGIGSGWLTRWTPIGGEVLLRLRENRAFHPPAGDRPLILIGAGTGLAGLRAHLQARAATGRRPNWLVFGERSAATDFFHRAEIEGWRSSGALARLDLAFSRDQPERVYVQHRLSAAADEVRRWVDRGAAIYVCGSIDSMAPAVADALKAALGEERLEHMAAEGLYRRDVY
ncbi:MAG: flavodoxin domain-containing protein [Alphaproteobacteria bacterium]